MPIADGADAPAGRRRSAGLPLRRPLRRAGRSAGPATTPTGHHPDGPPPRRPATTAPSGHHRAVCPRGIAREVNTRGSDGASIAIADPASAVGGTRGTRLEHGTLRSGDPGAGREGQPTGADHAEGAPAGGGVELTCNPVGSQEVGRPGSASRRARGLRATGRAAPGRRDGTRRAVRTVVCPLGHGPMTPGPPNGHARLSPSRVRGRSSGSRWAGQPSRREPRPSLSRPARRDSDHLSQSQPPRAALSRPSRGQGRPGGRASRPRLVPWRGRRPRGSPPPPPPHARRRSAP